jgi:hypothetical protein
MSHVAAINRSLYPETGGDLWRSIHQGNLDDCWFVAAVIALARFRPDELRRMVRPNPDGTFDVTFPGRRPVRGVSVSDEEIADYRRPHHGPDGLLLPVLEKAYGLLLRPKSRRAFEAINRPAVRAGKGIRLLTGRRSHTYYLCRGPFGWWLRFLRRRLEAALRAAPPSLGIVSDVNFRIIPGPKLPSGHLYALVDYDIPSAAVTLQDPYGGEPLPPLPLSHFVREYTFLFLEDPRR